MRGRTVVISRRRPCCSSRKSLKRPAMRRDSSSAATIRVSPVSRKTPGSILSFAGRGTMFNSAAGSTCAPAHVATVSRSNAASTLRRAFIDGPLSRAFRRRSPGARRPVAGAMPSSAAAVSPAAQGAGIAACHAAENHERFEVVAESARVIAVGRPEIDLPGAIFQIGIARRDTACRWRDSRPDPPARRRLYIRNAPARDRRPP